MKISQVYSKLKKIFVIFLFKYRQHEIIELLRMRCVVLPFASVVAMSDILLVRQIVEF